VAAQCADSLGNAVLSYDPLTQPGWLGIVITKQNRKPVIDSIQVIPASGPYLTVSTYTVCDSLGGNNDHNADFCEHITLNLTVSNVGVLTADNIAATLATSDTNVIVTGNTFALDSLPSGQTVIVPDAFALTVKNNVADQHLVHCTVTFVSDTSTWSSSLILNLNAPQLTVGNLTVLDPAPGGNNNGVLDPGETATLQIAMVNTGHADAGNATGQLVILPGSSSYIIALNPTYYIGSLPVNQTTYADFGVVTNGITPAGTGVQMNYTGLAGIQGQYSVQNPFSLVIGEVPQYIITNGTQGTCLADFYDTGGPDNGYVENEDFTMTFTPATPGAKLQVVFSAFDLEPESNCSYDWMKIYNGNSTGATLLGTWCGSGSPDSLASSDGSGALTFQFHSDYSVNYSGWAARIKCFGGPLNLLANAFPPQVCAGSSTQLTAIPSGGTGNYTYQWQPATYLDDPYSATPLCTPADNISYTVTVYDGTSSLTSSPVVVTVMPVPAPATISLQGADLVSSSANGNQWYLNGAMIPGANQQVFTPEDFGTYYVTVTDGTTGCFSLPSNTISLWATGIGTPGMPAPVSIFPNPFRDQYTVKYTLAQPGMIRITLVDGFGKTLRFLADASYAPAGEYTLTAGAGTLAPGLYYLRIQTDTYTVTRKLILTK
jgi:hypothetical protein